MVPTTSLWGVLTHLFLSLPPYVDAMESSYGQAEYNEIMSSHATLRPEAILSSSSCIMASFTPFLEMDKSGVMQSPEEMKKKKKEKHKICFKIEFTPIDQYFPHRPILFP